jgi:hypothetical protein
MAPQHSSDVLAPLLGALNLQAQRPKYPFVFLPDQMPQMPQLPQLPQITQIPQMPYMYPNVLPYPPLPYLMNCNEEQKTENFNVPFQMMKSPNGYILQDLESLTQQDPAIPRAVPAMWTNPSEMTLAKCLENREGITNVYIRGFLPETTDETLYAYASRFGKIDRCKAIVDLDTGLCKGYVCHLKLLRLFTHSAGSFGFVQYFNFESCENCIRGFFYLGYQASFAQVIQQPTYYPRWLTAITNMTQKSRNSRLKDLEDRSSTNIYCTNIPNDWTEAVSCPFEIPFLIQLTKLGPASPLRAIPCRV